MTAKEKKLIKAMDDLLNDTHKKRPLSISEFWAQSASASVSSCYKEGRVIDV